MELLLGAIAYTATGYLLAITIRKIRRGEL